MPGEEVEILQDDCPVARLVVGAKEVLSPEQLAVLTVIPDESGEHHLEKDLEDFEEEDLQYEPMPIEYSHTIEVTRNFVGEIPPQKYSWDDDD
jgi:antitoxin (DNA-binding transcriptional repressor) of toxin-antitoxin stability system